MKLNNKGTNTTYSCLFILVIVIIIAIALLNTGCNSNDPSESETIIIEVPDVIGMQYQEAEKTLDNEGLYIGNVKMISLKDIEVEDGVVKEQDPEAGATLEQGGKVDLTVDSGN